MPFTDDQVQTVLRRYIESNDAVGIVNRGHQFILSGMKELITSYGAPSHRPSNVRRLNYGMSLRIVDSLGVVSAAEYTLLEWINKLRNRIDHEDHEPCREDEATLYELWKNTLKVRNPSDESPYEAIHFPGLIAILLSLTYNVLSHRAIELAQHQLANRSDDASGATVLATIEHVYQVSILKDEPNTQHLKAFLDMFRLLRDAATNAKRDIGDGESTRQPDK